VDAAIEGPIHALFNKAGVNSSAGIATTIGVSYPARRRPSSGLLPGIPEGGAIANTASRAGNHRAAHAIEVGELLEIGVDFSGLTWGMA
jgi:hypothetical protein